MIKPLVSVLSPCYNVGPYIDRFIDSLIAQTYKNLEIIFINDGATDNSLEIIEGRTQQLQNEGYTVITKSKPNGGVASAINFGLKYFTGDYLTWPDPDDWLAPTSIEERVCHFEGHPDVGIIRCNAEMIEDDTGKSLGYFTAKSDVAYVNKTLFDDLSHIRTYFAPVCYMVRSSSFLALNPNRAIYHSRESAQNLQMLLPITQRYISVQINKPLGYYLVRKGSLSRSSANAQQHFDWDAVMCDVALRTLHAIDGLDCEYLTSLHDYFLRTKLAPGAFHARMEGETVSLIKGTSLVPLMQYLCIGLAKFRSSAWSQGLDRLSWGISSKIEHRIFRRLLSC